METIIYVVIVIALNKHDRNDIIPILKGETTILPSLLSVRRAMRVIYCFNSKHIENKLRGSWPQD